MQLSIIMFLLTLATGHALTAGGPVEQVVNLLTSMKADVEAEGKEDEKAYKEYACWCNKNKEDHETQETAQESEISVLENNIEADVKQEAELESQIELGEKSISEWKKTIAALTAMREQEAAAHQDETAEMKETIELLDEAIKTLSQVQFLQTSQRTSRSALGFNFNATGRTLHAKVGRYKNVMKRDLWELIASASKLLGNDAGLRSDMRALNQQALRGVPDYSKDVPAVPGFQDYYSQSDPVFGTLTQIKSDTEEDLAEAIAAEEAAIKTFKGLTAAKQTEIEESQNTVDTAKEGCYATRLRLVDAKHDLELTQNALAKDKQFLLTLKEACDNAGPNNEALTATRSEEVKALGEAISFLTGDEARDLFASAISFFQARQQASVSFGAKKEAQHTAMVSAQRHVLDTARRHENRALAVQAASMHLDSFTKVKEMMDKMMADLTDQRTADTAKRDSCIKEMDLTNDSITASTWEKEDLDTTKVGLAGDIGELNEEIAALTTSESELLVTLKGASEARKKENLIFQKEVSDQRATINILEKTTERLNMFYMKRLDLLQAQQQQDPVQNEPPAVKQYSPEYKKQDSAGAVELMRIIITDATKLDTQLTTTEQFAQTTYAKLVRDSTATAAATTEAIAAKNIELNTATAALQTTKHSIVKNQEELDSLVGVLADQHADCDWLLQHYNVRQISFAEEIESIRQAKAIVSGAKLS